MNNLTKNFITIFLIFLLISAIFSLYNSPFKKVKEVSLSELVTEINEEKVKLISVSGDDLEITLLDGTIEKAFKEPQSSLTDTLKNLGVEKNVDIKVTDTSGTNFIMGTLLPIFIPFLLFLGIIWMMVGRVQQGNTQAMMFGRSMARFISPEKNGKKKVTFGDVAGVKEAKEELKEVVDFLKNPKKFIDMGARIPRGVLIMGAPGTGKTLLARAVAGEAGVPFFSISGSEFVEMFVGVGASRVRDLFQTAKKNTPCIIFIDEIDAVGRQRGTGLGGGHDEREQTLNQILVEMDGFETDTNIIVMAATNRPDVLDPALLRPGRFDRRIILDEPDLNDREAILNVHGRNKPLSKDTDLRRIAERTAGFSGADLANLINEAAILAARRNKKTIEQQEFNESIEKIILGPERKSHILTTLEKKITAYHEAGHALVSASLTHTDPVHKISIISRGRAAGYTLKLPSEDRHLRTKSEFLDELAVFLAGFASEKMVFDELTTGATNDLAKATELARNLVMQYGMSEKLGPVAYGKRDEWVFLGRELAEGRHYSEKIAADIDKEVSTFIENAYETAQKILGKRRDKLDRIADELVKKETIEKDEFEKLMKE